MVSKLNTVPLRVHPEDKERLRERFLTEFLKTYPQFRGMYLSNAFLFGKLLDEFWR